METMGSVRWQCTKQLFKEQKLSKLGISKTRNEQQEMHNENKLFILKRRVCVCAFNLIVLGTL